MNAQLSVPFAKLNEVFSRASKKLAKSNFANTLEVRSLIRLRIRLSEMPENNMQEANKVNQEQRAIFVLT